MNCFSWTNSSHLFYFPADLIRKHPFVHLLLLFVSIFEILLFQIHFGGRSFACCRALFCGIICPLPFGKREMDLMADANVPSCHYVSPAITVLHNYTRVTAAPSVGLR
jgi:hypothetical protein